MSTTIRDLKADDITDFCRFLNEHFYGNEPLLQTPGHHTIILDTPEKREYRLRVIEQGLSLVAVDAEDRIIGAAFANEMVPSDLEKNWLKANEKKPTELLDHTHIFLSGTERRSHFFERYDVPKALYLCNLTVDSSIRCQGLGRRLVTALMDKGRSKGFPLLVTCCTSYYSTRVMLALDMECIHSENYSDYKDEDGNVVIRPPAPHTAANIMTIRL